MDAATLGPLYMGSLIVSGDTSIQFYYTRNGNKGNMTLFTLGQITHG